MSADRVALSGRVRAELDDLARVIERSARLFDKAQKSNDQDWLDGVALNLHSFYGGVESIFEEIAGEVDGGVPTGAEWRRQLLMQMAAELPSLRPAVITRNTRACLDEYRAFRHVVRNVYTYNLRPSRIQELVEGLPSCYAALAQDLAAFCSFLELPDFI
jgi:hypothetical protein